MYQDIWLNGKLVEKGERECESRYMAIKKYCLENIGSCFTVLDVGANMCYFGIRLIEDFNATVLALEFHQFEKRKKIVDKQKTDNLIFINRKLSLNDLQNMKRFSGFDLVLGLSVLHHVTEPIEYWIAAMKKISKHVIVEMAEGDSARTAIRKNYTFPEGEIIGYGNSHLQENFKRKIIAYK